MIEVCPAHSPTLEEPAHAELKQVRKRREMIVHLQRTQSRPHTVNMGITADDLHRMPDRSDLPLVFHLSLPREPVLKPGLHVECADLMEPSPSPGCPDEAWMIIADQSHNPPVHAFGDPGKDLFPVLPCFPSRKNLKHNEMCCCPLHRSQEDNGDHDIFSSTIAVEGIGNGNERDGCRGRRQVDRAGERPGAHMEPSPHAFPTGALIPCNPAKTKVLLEYALTEA